MGSETDEPRHVQEGSNRMLAVAIAVSLAAVVLVLVGLGPLFAASPEEPVAAPRPPRPPLRVVVARTAGSSSEWSNWAIVLQHLSERLDRTVVVRYVPEDEQAASVVASEDPDIALLCPHTYIDLLASGEVTGLAAPIVDGSAWTRSMLVVAEGSRFESFEDLAGTRAAVSDSSSLGGYAYMMWLCHDRGVEADSYFARLVTGGTQRENVEDVLEGRADCTVVSASQLGKNARRLRVVETSAPFGTPPIAAAASLNASSVAALRTALLDFDAAGELAGSGSGIEGFVPMEEVDYRFVRELSLACGHHLETTGTTAP